MHTIYTMVDTGPYLDIENQGTERCHDLELAHKVSAMSKITLASSAEVWLINLPENHLPIFIAMIWKD